MPQVIPTFCLGGRAVTHRADDREVRGSRPTGGETHFGALPPRGVKTHFIVLCAYDSKEPTVVPIFNIKLYNILMYSHIRPLTTDHRPLITDHWPLTSDNIPQTTDNRPMTTDHRPLSTNYRPRLKRHLLQTSDHKYYSMTSATRWSAKLDRARVYMLELFCRLILLSKNVLHCLFAKWLFYFEISVACMSIDQSLVMSFVLSPMFDGTIFCWMSPSGDSCFGGGLTSLC